jgi:hypothetical protein
MRQQHYNRSTNTLYIDPLLQSSEPMPVAHRSHGIGIVDLESDAWKSSAPYAVLGIAIIVLATVPGVPWLYWGVGFTWEIVGVFWLSTLVACFGGWWWTYAYYTNENRRLVTTRYTAETRRIYDEVEPDDTDAPEVGDPLPIAPRPKTYTPQETEEFALAAVLENLFDGGHALRGGAFIQVGETGEVIKQERQRELLEKLKRLDIVEGGKGDPTKPGKGKEWRVKYAWTSLEEAFSALDAALDNRDFPKPVAGTP